MKSKKIHLALAYLNVYELNSFKKFLLSPYFNQNSAINSYFDILDTTIRSDEELSNLKNEAVWKKIFGTEPYNDVRFRKLNSDISKLFENFLAVKEMEQDPTLTNSLKIKAFKAKKMSNLYPGLITHINSAKKTQQDRSADYYLDLFNIEKSIFGLQTDAERKSKSKDPVKNLNIEEISLNLDVFYIAEKLKYYCTILSWSRSYKIDKKIAGIEFILKLAKIPLFSEYPPVKLYYTISRTIADENNLDHYYLLKQLIDQYIHLFPGDEAREIMEAAISYCVVKMNKGNNDFIKEAFLMYKKAINEKLIFDDENLSPVAYRNVAIIAMRAEEVEWAEKFILEYSDLVKEDFRENAKNFSLARLEFFKLNYSNVIDYLNQIDMNDFFYNVSVRTLLLVSYYELEEYLPLDSLLQSFNAWVVREKSLTKESKARYQKLIRFTKRLANTPHYEKEKLLKLKIEVTDAKGVVSKDWLLEKIETKITGKKKQEIRK